MCEHTDDTNAFYSKSDVMHLSRLETYNVYAFSFQKEGGKSKSQYLFVCDLCLNTFVDYQY